MNWSIESLDCISRIIYFWIHKDNASNTEIHSCISLQYHMEFTIIDEYKDQIIKFSDMSFAINNKNENNLLISVDKNRPLAPSTPNSWLLIPKELAEKLIIYKELKK